MEFRLHSEYQPTGDQPEAIAALTEGFREGNQAQTLLGVTGSAIGNYETGVSSPKAEVLCRAFDALECDANYLFQDAMSSSRGEVLSLREQEYVLAAETAGAGGSWIIRKHLIPNCISVIVISTALQIPSAIFTESYLSFLGLGVNAPMPSLGSLASDALNGINSYPYRLVIPAVVISLIVLSLNLFGDGLRDAFDPKLNG